jgi:hypothetical protein
MLTITPETFAAMESQEERAFVGRLVAFLRDSVPELRDESATAMEAQTRLQIDRARGFGMRSERAVACYALTAAMLGPDFPDRFPAARRILEAPTNETVKAERLEAFTTALFDALDRDG